MTLIEESIEILNERVRRCESKLNEISGVLTALRGDNNVFHMYIGANLKNLNKQVYNIKKILDISKAYKEFKEEWDDEDNFG